jgi:hypothetical protein
MRHAQHLVRLGIVLDRPEIETCADISFAATCLFHAREPDVGIKASA